MKTVHKSVLIWYSAQQMFDLVTDVASYPRFLPWCDRTDILQHDPAGMTARIGMAFAGLRQGFTTRNGHESEGAARRVTMALVDGPFSRLDGVWDFRPLDNAPAGTPACRVELRLNYDFQNPALAAVVGPVFDKIASGLVDAFVRRAEQVYAGSASAGPA